MSLQREYELLELPVDTIALKHQRTVNSILFKLQEEGLISTWDEARGFDDVSVSPTWKTMGSMSQDEEDDDEDFEEDDEDFEEDDEDEEDDDFEEEEDDDEDCEEDNTSQVSKLAERVWTLESTVSDISVMVKQIFDSVISKKRPTVSAM
jgi:TATA-binding protein-associated factor Taf7